MNREIKFRGQLVGTKEWVYGDLVHQYWKQGDTFLECAIRYKIKGVYSYPMEVIPESVGQFTGLHDKNGIEIYEGDIVSLMDEEVTVLYNSSQASFDFMMVSGECAPMVLSNGWEPNRDHIEITGNIHQTPPTP